MRTRSKSGKFVSLSAKDQDLKEPTPAPENENLVRRNPPHRNLFNTWNIVKLIAALILLSPWLRMLYKSNNLENISNKINDFYDDNFSCKCSCPDDSKLKENEKISVVSQPVKNNNL